MVEIILSSGSGGVKDQKNLRRIRSHAMKHVRQRQREGSQIRGANVSNGHAHVGGRSASFGVLRPSTMSSGARTRGQKEITLHNSTRRRQQSYTKAKSRHPRVRARSQILHFHSAAAYRSFLTEEFFTYLPNSGPERYAIGTKLHHWSLSNPEAMAAVMDGLLFKLSYEHHDERFLLAARESYLRAISRLRTELQGPQNAFRTLQGVLTLLNLEKYAAIAQDSLAWTQHTSGIFALMSRSGQSIYQTPIGPTAFRLARFNCLLHGLVLRRRLPLKVIPLLGSQGATPSYYLESFIRRALYLPELLEHADTVLNSRYRPMESIMGVIGRLRTLDEELTSSLRHELLSHFSLVAITEFDLNIPALARPSYVFSDALSFPCFLSAVSHSLYWTCLLVLRSVQQDLTSVLFSAEYPQLGLDETNYGLRKVEDVANMLCKSIPYLLQSAGGAVGQAIAIRAPLYFVKRYFEHINSCERLEWCCKIEAGVQERAGYLQWDALLPLGFGSLNWLS